jgi:NADH-quinone oxidoreductase subunit H
MNDQPLWITYIFGFILLNVMLGAMAYMTYAERKVIAFMQDRIGPNRTGPFGLLQPIADGVKLLGKEDLIPKFADKRIFVIAPLVSFVTAPLSALVIPFGDQVTIFGRDVRLYATDINVAALYILAIGSVGVYGIILGGYASANRYSLLGALRAAAQVISYEIVLGLSLVGVFLLAGSLSLVQIVNNQRTDLDIGFGWIGLDYTLTLPNWYIFSQPLGFIIFLIAAVAETNRAPFDLPEAETELISGFHTEYSGFRFSFYFLAEYINMIVVSLLASTLFLGGIDGPIKDGVWWLLIKMSIFLFFYIWLRATLPRFRYDQLMGIAWKVLLPLVLVNVLITGFIRLAGNDEISAQAVWIAVAIAVFAFLVMFFLSLRREARVA